MPILYSKEPGAIGGLTVNGEELIQTQPGVFDVPAMLVPDLVATFPGLTDVRPAYIDAKPEGKKSAKPAAEPEA